MNLVADYDSSSSGSDVDQNKKKSTDVELLSKLNNEKTEPPVLLPHIQEQETEKRANETNTNCIELPSAKSVMKRRVSSESSALATEYKREQDDKNKILEQHVKMVTNSKSTNGKVNGKKVCWMYRRGRCRLGKKCKMYHDSELRKTEAVEKPPTNNISEIPKNSPQKRSYEEVSPAVIDDDEIQPKTKIHKKKFGLSDDIVPPKKVIEHLERVGKTCH
ncbi:uncharacterized protein LOC120343406 [Styela clava]